MIETLVWDKVSLLDVSKDTMSASTGTVNINEKALVLSAESTATFEYIYDTSSNKLETEDLKFILDVANSDTSVNSRYNEDVQVEVYIQYYEKQVDAYGNVVGYILGNTDTYQINPYFIHETEGYINEYEVKVEKQPWATIQVNFINISENEVTFNNPQMIKSMEIMDAIDEYGGGYNPDEPPLENSINIYNIDGSGDYDIGSSSDELTLRVYIPDELRSTAIYITWAINAISGNPNYIATYEDETIVINGLTYNAKNTKVRLKGLANGKIKLTATLGDSAGIYDEQEVTISNCNVTDAELVLLNGDTSIRGAEPVNAQIRFIPALTQSSDSGYMDMRISVDSYDGQGEAFVADINGNYASYADLYCNGGVINCKFKGLAEGMIKIRVQIDAKDGHNNIYPIGFTKEFLINVENIPEQAMVEVTTPDGTTIDTSHQSILVEIKSLVGNLNRGNTSIEYESINGGEVVGVVQGTSYETNPVVVKVTGSAIGRSKILISVYTANGSFLNRVPVEINVASLTETTDIYLVSPDGTEMTTEISELILIAGTRRSYALYNNYINYGVTSLDNTGNAYVEKLTTANAATCEFKLHPISVGRVLFWCELYEYVSGGRYYVGRLEQEINIASMNELNIEVESSTGSFVIDRAGGQLELHPIANYSYAGGFSFRQVSVDGGAVTIEDKGNYALITASTPGKVNIISTPDFGTEVTTEININIQNCWFETPDGTDITLDKTSLTVNICVASYSVDYNYTSYGTRTIDGGEVYVENMATGHVNPMALKIYPVKLGKVTLYANVYRYEKISSRPFVGYIELEINVVSMSELEIVVTSSTGSFEINSVGGQLELHPSANYSYHGDFSFRQTSIDGGSVTIADQGDYALITAGNPGKLNVITSPVKGPEVNTEININI